MTPEDPASREGLVALAAACENVMGSDNALDVQIEIALFRPNSVYSAVRANAAGTKVIYTDRDGNDVTCWSEDWTMEPRRRSTAAALRARATLSRLETRAEGEG